LHFVKHEAAENIIPTDTNERYFQSKARRTASKDRRRGANAQCGGINKFLGLIKYGRHIPCQNQIGVDFAGDYDVK
jgi:hypothetical protein